MLTTQVPGSLFTSSNSTPSLLIYMIPYLTSPFIDLWLLIYAPDLFCDVTFPLTLPFLSGCLRTLRDSYVTFDFLLPIPFYLFPDFNLLPNNTFVFDFSKIHILNSFFYPGYPLCYGQSLLNSNVQLKCDFSLRLSPQPTYPQVPMTLSTDEKPSRQPGPFLSAPPTTFQTQDLSPSQTIRSTASNFLQHQRRSLELVRPAETLR